MAMPLPQVEPSLKTFVGRLYEPQLVNLVSGQELRYSLFNCITHTSEHIVHSLH